MNTGYYEYGVADYTMPRRSNGLPHIRKHRIKIEIIAIGLTRTKVQFLEWHIDGRGPGTISTVKNRNITTNSNRFFRYPAVEYRRPYKDD